jgi:uncharacterized protein YkwD
MTRTAHRFGILLVLAAAALLLTPLPVDASSQWGSSEERFVEKINAERRARGLNSLAVDVELRRVARGWTDRMAREDRLYHNPNMRNEVQRNWQRLGENVGFTVAPGISHHDLVDRLHRAFMNSPGHAANVRGDWTAVGVGVRVTSSNKMWVTVNFMKGGRVESPPTRQASAPAGPSIPEFDDVPASNPHAAAIRRIAGEGVTEGCGPRRYCPAAPVTRGQMASFLARSLDLEPVNGNRFRDAGAPHAQAINALAASGITQGCQPGRFCASDPITREQMATFLARAAELPTTSAQHFRDTNGSVHRDSINAVAAAGITRGCEAGRFCPRNAVTRAEMASFLTRMMDR